MGIGKGVYVQDLVEGGNADIQGIVKPGDVLVGITAVKIVGAKWERRLIPCRTFDFDTMVGAVGSNDPKWGCSDVILLKDLTRQILLRLIDLWNFLNLPQTLHGNSA